MTLFERIQAAEAATPVTTRRQALEGLEHLPEEALELFARIHAGDRHQQRVERARALAEAVSLIVCSETENGIEAPAQRPGEASDYQAVTAVLLRAAYQGCGGPAGLGWFGENQTVGNVGHDRRSERLWPFSRCGKGRSGAQDGGAWDTALLGASQLDSTWRCLSPLSTARALARCLEWVELAPGEPLASRGEQADAAQYGGSGWTVTDGQTRATWAADLIAHVRAIAGAEMLRRDSQVRAWAELFARSSSPWTAEEVWGMIPDFLPGGAYGPPKIPEGQVGYAGQALVEGLVQGTWRAED